MGRSDLIAKQIPVQCTIELCINNNPISGGNEHFNLLS